MTTSAFFRIEGSAGRLVSGGVVFLTRNYHVWLCQRVGVLNHAMALYATISTPVASLARIVFILASILTTDCCLPGVACTTSLMQMCALAHA